MTHVPYDVLGVKTVGYLEFAVPTALADRVVCTWIDRRTDPHAVLPDACIDLVWDGEHVGVAGPDTRAWAITAGKTYAGIRFRPGAAPGVLGLPASELLNRDVLLGDIWGAHRARELEGQLAEAEIEAAPRILECAIARHLANGDAEAPDPLVDAVLRVVQSPPREREGEGEAEVALVQHIADSTGVSPRSLHRRCTVALGYGPKTLDRILRFRRAVRLIGRQVRLAEAAVRAGYADQAHLTNEFRRLAGVTPRELSSAGPLVLSANGL